jgi:hypothetical protein
MNKPSASEKVSAEINSIRAAAGWDGLKCTTCCRDLGSPFRVYDASGKVTHGCIDSSHDGHLVQTSESNRWHHRPEAQAMRRAERDKLRGYNKAARALERRA